MISFFAVINYVVRKFAFCGIFCVNLIGKNPLAHFYRFENSLYFMKHDPEVKIFYTDRHFYNS